MKKENELEEGATSPIEEKPAAQSKKGDEVKVNGAKKVKITPTEDVDCIIARKSYKLTKGKQYQVPSDVAAILCYAEKAYRN